MSNNFKSNQSYWYVDEVFSSDLISRKLIINLLFLSMPFFCFSQFSNKGNIEDYSFLQFMPEEKEATETVERAASTEVILKGKVVDEVGPSAFANVVLQDQDGKFVTGTVTADDGTFEILAAPGTYKLLVTFLGYDNYAMEVVLEKDTSIPDIVMTSGANQLAEVVVSARKRVIERKVDRLVFKVENNIATTGGNALDALKLAPGVFVDSEGQINMIGKSGMRVMVDGRIIQLTGEELVTFLNSIPADDVKEVEIITNPPAKYEAQGNSGLINIIYKKGKGNLWSNNTVFSYTQAKLGSYSLKNNFNYKKDKLSLLFSLSGNLGDRHVIQKGETYYSKGPWKFDIDQVGTQDGVTGRVMMDYEVGERSKVGVQYMGSLNNPDIKDNTVTRIFNNSNIVDSMLITDRFGDRDISYHSVNTYYEIGFDTLGRKMSIDLDYFNYNTDEFVDVNTENFLPSNESLGRSFSNVSDLNQTLNNYNVKVDVEHPLKAANLSYGANLSFTNNTYFIENFNTLGENPIINPLQSDNFEYIENKQAAYVNASKKFNSKWESQIGLRVENTDAKGISKRLNQTNPFNYLKAFPTFYLSFNPDESNSLSFNYGRRIDRPSYGQLNPARNYINSNTYSVGNPFLQPAFTDNFELTHVYKGNLVSQLFFSYDTDGYSSVFSADNITNEQALIKANYYNKLDYGIAEFYTFDKVSWWQSQNSLYLLNSTSSIYNPEVNAEVTNSFRVYAGTNNSFVLSREKGIKSQVNFWYSSPYANNIYEYSEGYSLDLALQFSILQKSVLMSVGVYDVLNTSPLVRTTTVNDIKQVYGVYPSNRYFRMSMVYKLGSNKLNLRKRRFGNEEDQDRAN